MSVRVIDDRDDLAFDRYVAGHARGTLFHTTGWRETVRDVAAHDPIYLIAEREGRIRGVLPLFHVRSLLGGNMLVSVPYAVYGGVLADDDEARDQLIQAARALADELRVRHLELREIEAADDGLATSSLYVTFFKDLPDDKDACLELIPRKSRATTRHARDKHGMEFVEGVEYLGAFHDLFVRNKTQLGSPSFSRGFFENLLIRFPDRVWLQAVKMQGEVIAAVLSFVHGETINPYYSGSKPGTERLGSMNFMYWQVMERAVERGLRRYDFGRSRVDTGAYDFKRNMGFEPTALHYRYYLRDGAELPSINPSNPKFERVQAVWRRLPRPVLDVLGPWMMRHLP